MPDIDDTYAARLTSRSFREATGDLLTSRADLRVTDFILGGRVFEWLNAVGVTVEPSLRALVPPFPPLALRQIVSDHQLEVFLWTGYLDAEHMARTMDRWIAPRGTRILDFGAGCGRVVRFFGSLGTDSEVHGVDVNPAHVEWCRDNLPFVTSQRCGERPPLPYADAHFDCVYAISVMTHLDKERGVEWRDELARITKPQGIIILTTHGYPVLERIENTVALQNWFRMSRDRVMAIRDCLPSQGHVFEQYDSDVIERAQAGRTYGVSFTDPDFARTWLGTEQLEVVDQEIAGLRGWQDVVVLRRTSS